MNQIIAPDCREKTVLLPTSKSISHRIFILAGLNKGQTTVTHWLNAEDTDITLKALQQMGIKCKNKNNALIFTSPIGRVNGEKVFLGNSGSSARFLIPQAAFLDKPIFFMVIPDSINVLSPNCLPPCGNLILTLSVKILRFRPISIPAK